MKVFLDHWIIMVYNFFGQIIFEVNVELFLAYEQANTWYIRKILEFLALLC